MDRNPDWKTKYQECQRELDYHNLHLNKLQKGLLKLALVYNGRDPEFNHLVNLITETLRKDNKNATIEGKLYDVINRVIKFSLEDKNKLKASPQKASNPKFIQEEPVISKEKLAGFLQNIPSPLEMQADIQILVGEINRAGSKGDLENLVDQAVSVITEYLHPLTSQQLPANTDSNNQQLLQLLAKVNFDEKNKAKIKYTEAILSGKEAMLKAKSAPDMVADLINTSVMRDQALQDVGTFMKKVTLRLESLHKYLDQSDLIKSDHFSEAFSSSQDLDEQFYEVKEGLESSGSITAMQFNIEAHLDFLNKNVSDYVKREKNRLKTVAVKMGALNSQLGELQVETEVLKKSVEKEQVKSLTDALTSIANRRAYEERLKVEISRWKRYGGHLSLMVFDLDKFKKINDNYGHAVGDKVLRGLTSTFKREIRESDFLARYGGEEFVMILPGTSLQDTMAIADKFRYEVEHCIFRYQGKEVPVTVSIGVAEFHENDTGASVFSRADEALYLAKKSGRNICRCEADLVGAV